MPAPRRGAITGATFGATNNNTTTTNNNPTMASGFGFGTANTPAAPAAPGAAPPVPNLFGASTTPGTRKNALDFLFYQIP